VKESSLEVPTLKLKNSTGAVLGDAYQRLKQRWVYIIIVPIIWELAAWNHPAYVFPGFFDVISKLPQLYFSQYDVIEHNLMTIVRIMLVFLITVPISTVTGVLMGSNEVFEAYFTPYVLIPMAFPSIVWAFIGVTWFGLTQLLVPVLVGFVIIFPYVTINMWEGTKNIDKSRVEMATSFGASRFQMWREIIIPQLMPYLYSMMRFTLAIAWKVMLVAELFGAQSGIGFIIREWFRAERVDLIIVWVLPILMLIYVVDRLISYCEDKFYEWRTEDRTTQRNVA
jgi:NitT/TauT family transport system permease protein